MKIVRSKKFSSGDNLVIITSNPKKLILSEYDLSKKELQFLIRQFEDDKEIVSINRLDHILFFYFYGKSKKKGQTELYRAKEKARIAGSELLNEIKKFKLKEIKLVSGETGSSLTTAFIEGMALANYTFLKYSKEKRKKSNALNKISVFGKEISDKDIHRLNSITSSVFFARDLVNEPLSYLNAPKLAEEIKAAGKRAGFKVTVFNKKKISDLGMGGLLAVNKGSIDPPVFTILEWKPQKPVNKTPIVLVGKGVVYDTGGLSLKPTKNSMDFMKSDMGGAAAVAGIFEYVASEKLNVHVIGLIPATDNRPDGNAYVPGDVIEMFNGMTVEVLNTDAEGRMILADALSYADKYKPGLIIDMATLTGAASAAIGPKGIVAMGNAERKWFRLLEKSGEEVYERIVEFPFWDEYSELLKSDIADIKNIGGAYAGAITAGKFLERFTDRPYIHLDVAGPAFSTENDAYRLKGGTGVAVRLISKFLESIKD